MMKPIDSKIKYYELLMHYDDTSKYNKHELPGGYHFEFYKDGNVNDWLNIHLSPGTFIT